MANQLHINEKLKKQGKFKPSRLRAEITRSGSCLPYNMPCARLLNLPKNIKYLSITTLRAIKQLPLQICAIEYSVSIVSLI